MAHFPALPGSYAIHYSLRLASRIQIGRLGEIHFPAGEYIYLGSARGPGGLRARLHRHLGATPVKRHWHIDHLHAIAQPRACCYLLDADLPKSSSSQSIECAWSRALASFAGATIPVKGFGATDCRGRCLAHLIAFPYETQPSNSLLVNPNIKKLLAKQANIHQKAIICSCLGRV